MSIPTPSPTWVSDACNCILIRRHGNSIPYINFLGVHVLYMFCIHVLYMYCKDVILFTLQYMYF